jgi:signal transduction histidine kinase
VASERIQPWRVASFVEDADLDGRGIFYLDFETDGTVWIAASDGLYRYDGYGWDRFTSADGLPSDYVRSVRVTREGELWVGTDQGAGVFDGETFDTRGSETHLPGPSVRRIVEDPDGTVWFCCDQWPPSRVQSGLARYRDGEWKSWGASDGLPSDYVSDVFRDSHGRHFVLTREGLAEFDGDRLRRPIEEAGLEACRDYIWSMAESSDGQLVVNTNDTVCVREHGRWRAVPKKPRALGGGALTSTRDGAVLGFAQLANGTFMEWRKDRFVPIRTTSLETIEKVEYIGEAPDGSVWIAGVDLLVRWERAGGEWSRYDDLPPPKLRDVLGGVWFADRDRVLRRSGDQWSRIPDANSPLLSDRADGVWMHAPRELVRWSPAGLTRFSESEVGLEAPRVVGVDGAGTVWAIDRGPDPRQRVSSFDGTSWKAQDLSNVGPTERIVESSPDASRGMWFVLDDVETDLYRLLYFDGATSREVTIPVETRRYWMPRVSADASGQLWLYGFAGLYTRSPGASDGAWLQITELPGRQVQELAMRGSEVWFSYRGTTGGSGGVSRLLDGEWQHLSGAARDLTAGDTNDSLFFNDSRGVHFVAGDSAAPPRLLTLPEPGRVTALVAGERSDFWLATRERVYHYRPDGIPPETVIASGDRHVVYGEPLVLKVRGVERFVPRTELRDFSVAVRVDDQSWGDFEPLADGSVSVGGLNVGDHVVQVRVRDQGLHVDPTPAVWDFRLHPIPLQHRSWFQPLAVGIFLTVLLLAVLSIVSRQREIGHRKKTLEAEHELLQISERERRRIGRDLHDSLGQRLTGISFQCEAMRGSLAKGRESASQQAGEIGAAVRGAIAETRRMAYALYPPQIDRGSVEEALGSLVASTGQGFDGPCKFHYRWSPAKLSQESALHVYRLVQEALVNAIRHAAATKLDVESRRDDGHWVVEVRDDGCGFDPKQPSVSGLGLRTMRYRADVMGGRLRVESAPGAGTTIRCRVRVEDEPDPAQPR